ncbi:DUF1501 domain-containing protein [Candidatus Rariloculus sp.]|uniref:DUF1501 domain-containing protein n=1 Tax=Candidatus Rariloculus sp. TaxID=3101265 RepID=UPI003D0BF335
MVKRDANHSRPHSERTAALSRRCFLGHAGAGLGSIALYDLLDGSLAQAAEPAGADLGVLQTPHHRARAKRVIFLFMAGAPSQIECFDHKPDLVRLHGTEAPDSIMGTQRLSTMVKGQTTFPLVAPIAPLSQRGASGAWISDLLPHMGSVIDEFTIIKSMYTEQVNHDPAIKFIQSGFQLAGRPSMGSWVHYGLGSDNADLPSFIVMSSRGVGPGQNINSEIWSSGFLPSHHGGVLFRPGDDPVLYVGNPDGISSEARGRAIDAIVDLARAQHEQTGNTEILSKITQYEMAYRMQSSVPEATDVGDEPDHVLELYGESVHTPGSFARNCLLARRLAEREVKFVQLYHNAWDHHSGHPVFHPVSMREVDQATAGLIQDLKQRGLLEDTLVVWGAEFGRTCFAQGELVGENWGRDHHPGCFTYLMAGGGVKRGYSHGETDDLSYNVVKDPVHVHDLQATMMHALGIDHERLTFRYQGRDFRVTDVHGRVVHELFA